MPNNAFSILSFVYSIFLTIIFFSKERIKTRETEMYKLLVLINDWTVLSVLICWFTIIYRDKMPFINDVFSKSALVGYLLWVLVFTLYVYSISQNEKEKKFIAKYRLRKIILIILGCVLIELIILLPLNYFSDYKVAYSFGPSANVVYILTAVSVLSWIILCFKNIKNLKNKKYLPVFSFIVLIIISTVIQKINPTILLTTAVVTFVTTIMYFTIENPDVKMIEQLNIAKDQAEKANKAKTDFLSSMSHEIRTPLNAIDGFSQLILEEKELKVIKEEARDIMTASQNLLEIVNGILDISKIEANKLEIVNTIYEPKKVFDELSKLTKARIGEKPLEFRVNIAPDLPEYLNGDYIRLKQIIINLLTNAVKYTKKGFVEFNVNIVKTNNICRLIISVKDSGIGIKKENIDKLFTKFERFDKEKNMTIEGTGLGLAITKKLVELMKGKIVVDSVYGEGSTFTVSIDQRLVDKTKVKVAEVEDKKEKKLKVKGKKVLIVDDNLINLKVASRLLGTYKIITEEVSSGADCIKKIEEGNTYDLILMDDMMPKLSGVETFKLLQKRDDFNIPTIALTANAIAGMREKYLNMGFNDYISKPIDKKELERVLKTYLN